MKLYRICVESYYSNNSDLKEYNNYYQQAHNREEAIKLTKQVIDNLNKNSQGVIYNIFDVTPRN